MYLHVRRHMVSACKKQSTVRHTHAHVASNTLHGRVCGALWTVFCMHWKEGGGVTVRSRQGEGRRGKEGEGSRFEGGTCPVARLTTSRLQLTSLRTLQSKRNRQHAQHVANARRGREEREGRRRGHDSKAARALWRG